MELTHIIQVVLGVVISMMAILLKRIFAQLDSTVKRLHDVEHEVATLAAESRERVRRR